MHSLAAETRARGTQAGEITARKIGGKIATWIGRLVLAGMFLGLCAVVATVSGIYSFILFAQIF